MPKEQLPAEVVTHFQKANLLHSYVQKSLGEATKHALETGQHLLAAKAALPHGRWEEECGRIFDASPRTAQFYMSFARDISALPKPQASAVLLLEGTLEGAAKAARQAARPEPEPDPEPPAEDEPFEDEWIPGEDDRTDSDEVDEQESTSGSPGGTGTEASAGPLKKKSKAWWFKQYTETIGATIRTINKAHKDHPNKARCNALKECLHSATEEAEKWLNQ